jgi:hypothetical protein
MDRSYRVGARRQIPIVALIPLAALLAASCRDSSGLAMPKGAPVIDLLAAPEPESVAETRLILFGTGDRTHLLDGWSFDERNRNIGVAFVWATAPEANLNLDVLEVEDKQFLVKLTSYLTPEPQRITVLANGHEVTEFSAAPIFLEYRFVVPAKWLQRGANRLTFRHSSLGTPPRGPKRQLAAAYTEILIGPECLPLRGFGRAPPPRIDRRPPNETEPAALIVTGPAEVRHRMEVPPGATFQARVALPRGEPRAANFSVWVTEEGKTTRLVATRLSPPWFGPAMFRDIEADLSPWSGKTAELAVEVRPDACRSPVATVIIERAGIFPGAH